MKTSLSVINSGSSSIKFSLYDNLDQQELRLLFNGQVEGIGVSPHFKVQDGDNDLVDERFWENDAAVNHEQCISFIIDWIREHRQQLGLELLGVGHRVVHGGQAYSAPVVVDDEVLATLGRFIPLAPLHQPHNLISIRAIQKINPDIRQVACFDTAFHHTNPVVAQQFGLPRRLTDEGIRRYGFHGLSYEYIGRRLTTLAPVLGKSRVIVAHLGSGSSMCAMSEGKSVASTMGFSAMDGLLMGTRPGNLDPGVVLYLMQEKKMGPEEISNLCYRQCGLLGVSGISNDMRVLLDSDDPRAKEAVNLFIYRIRREIGSLAASLGGLDCLVFTAGIGENSPQIREMICDAAQWFGVELDREANNQKRQIISSDDSLVSVWTIPTNEELMIATHTRDILQS